MLGCTHYPFVRDAIAKELGEEVPILDGSLGTARETKRRLTAAGLLREREEGGSVIFENSIPEKVELCRRLLGQS